MQSKAATVQEYLQSLPDDRRTALTAVRDVILSSLNEGFQERMAYGMIGYCVPHTLYPAGYHCDPKQPLPFAGLASQKQYMSLYLMSNYNRGDFWKWFEGAWRKSGKRLDMGKACIRFKKLDDLPLDVVAEAFRKITVAEYVAEYEALLAGVRAGKPVRKTQPAKSPARKKTASSSRAKPGLKSGATRKAKKTKSKPAARR